MLLYMIIIQCGVDQSQARLHGSSRSDLHVNHMGYRPDGTSGKKFASGVGGMGLKSRADQISHTLPMTRHHCNLDVWALVQSCEDGHRSLVTPKRVLSEYNKDLILI